VEKKKEVPLWLKNNKLLAGLDSRRLGVNIQRASAQPDAESCHPSPETETLAGDSVETHWVSSFSLESCEFCSVDKRREPSPTRGFACQALSVSSVYLSVCVSVCLHWCVPCCAQLQLQWDLYCCTNVWVRMWILSPTGPHTHSKINGSHRGLLLIRVEHSAEFGKREWDRECTSSSVSLSTQPVIWGMSEENVSEMIWKHSPLRC